MSITFIFLAFALLVFTQDMLCLTISDATNPNIMFGKIVKIIPNKELSYSWKHKDNPDFPDTIVSWKLEKLDENKTRVILRHNGFTDKDRREYENHSQGWSWFITRLNNFVTKGEP